MGACIQCGHKSCFEAFHVTCARRARLCLKMKSSSASNSLDASVLKAYCDRHSPADWKRENDVEGCLDEAIYHYRKTFKHVRWPDSQAYALSIGSSHPMPSIEGLEEEEATPGNKRKRGQPGKAGRLPSGAPVVPQCVYRNVENALTKFNFRKRKEFVQEACKYWTLKRESRRGAALLKRLQLQMDAFSSMEITRRNFVGMGAAGRPRLQRRVEFAEYLEKDMERIRNICQMTKEREQMKLDDILILKKLMDTIYFPISPLLGEIVTKALGQVPPSLDKLSTNDTSSYDPRGVFKEAVTDIKTKVEQHYYTSVQNFSEDMAAVYSSGIGLSTITGSSDAHQQPEVAAHSTLTADQKEIKKLAKRIIKGIQPPLDEALEKEASLTGRSKQAEQEIPSLEALFDQHMQRQQAVSTAGDDVLQTVESDQHDALDAEAGKVNGAPTPEENIGDHHAMRDEAADEVAIAAQLGQDAMHADGEPSRDPMNIDQQAAPPTPPASDQDQHGIIHHGGVPSYLAKFDIAGTTVHEEVWDGRELLREMSLDLSEVDEEELSNMQPEASAPEEEAVSQSVVSETVQKTKKQKRRRPRW
jgi:NuA3 HAT complex component NTO1